MTTYTLDEIKGEERFDSRDLIETLEMLTDEDQRELMTPEERLDADEMIAAIREIEDCVEDWPYGAAFIREDKFEEYAQELAEDIGAISRDAAWPLSFIDWDAAADALAMDYTSVSFLGHDYYVR